LRAFLNAYRSDQHDLERTLVIASARDASEHDMHRASDIHSNKPGISSMKFSFAVLQGHCVFLDGSL
jgi:hypothetical protein